MLLSKLIEVIESEFPSGSALKGDPIGLRIQSGNNQIKNILIALEVNDEVIDSAVKLGCDCIISFHPLIFSPLTEILDEERVGYLVTRLIRNNISQITIHTNFDVYINGTNKIFADLLNLQNRRFLIENNEFQNKGMGIIGELEVPISYNQLAELLFNKTNSPVRYNYGKSEIIKKIAIVCGSGTSFLNDVLKTNCDAFITADATYHTFHRLKGKLALFDIGHYEMEQFVPENLKNILNSLLDDDVKLHLSTALTNPIEYFPNFELKEKQINYLNNQKGL